MFNCDIPLNYESLLEIDVNYGGTAVRAALKEGITSVVPSNNETNDQKSYISGQGFAETFVTGAQKTLVITGDRVNNTAQNYIADMQDKLGCGRKTQAWFTSYDGVVKSGEVTITNIVAEGGEAPARGTFSCEIHFNGKPTTTAATSAPALTATVAAGSVTGSTKFTATPTGDNTLGYLLTNGAVNTPNALAFAGVYAYTSGSDIAATAGQFLNMFELDSNGRIVKFLSQELTSGDIA